MKVEKGSKITKTPTPYYIELTNAYFSLAEFSAGPSTEPTNTNYTKKKESNFKKKAAKRRKIKKINKVKKYLSKKVDT